MNERESGTTVEIQENVDGSRALRELAEEMDRGQVYGVAILAFLTGDRKQEIVLIPKPPDVPGLVPEEARDRLMTLSQQLHAMATGCSTIAGNIPIPKAGEQN